jgi:hypothetical protein
MDFLSPLEHYVGALAESDRDEILGAADGVADSFFDQTVTTIVSNLPKGGIKDIEWGGIKSALLASLPQEDQLLNDKISNLFDVIVTKLQKAGTP